MTMLDTDIWESVSLFEDTPCEYASHLPELPQCPHPAVAFATHSCCGRTYTVCESHKQRLCELMDEFRDRARCVLCDERIRSINFTPF